MKGIDVSKWNGSNDFELAKKSGTEFVIIRSNFGYSDSFKNSGFDPYFEENYNRCRQANLPIGVYCYNYANTVSQAREEAQRTLTCINNKTVDIAVFCDAEDQEFLKGDNVTDKIIAYLKYIKDAGYKIGVYANKNWFDNHIDLNRIKNELGQVITWIAHYNSNLYNNNPNHYKGQYDIWQYGSEGYTMPGISGTGGGISYVDTNISYIDFNNEYGTSNDSETVTEIENPIIQKVIDWYYARKGKISYSMIHRDGPNSYDCSSSIYYAHRECGFPKASYPCNTETLHEWLMNNGYERISTNTPWNSIRGDIFIWGKRAASLGGAGHTGIFIDDKNIIHTNYSANGISITNYNDTWNYAGKPYYRVYRLKDLYIKTTSQEDYMKEIQERYLVSGDYSIDNLPWYCDDKNNVGTTKDYIGFVVTVSRKWGNYWYSKYLNGWVDSRAFTSVITTPETKVKIEKEGFSIDTLPWYYHEDKNYETKYLTKDKLGEEYTMTARTSDTGGYCYLQEIAKWVDNRALNLPEHNIPEKKTDDQIVDEILEGKWGNGEERKTLLADAGYNYNNIQAKINEKLGVNKESNDKIAQQVVDGKWGNGAERRRKLTEAGYDFNAIQNLVNDLLK